MSVSNIVQSLETHRKFWGVRRWGLRLVAAKPGGLISLIYLAISLPTMLYLCFLTPPMQVADEGRHFLRACQIADGGIVSQIDANTNQAGGLLPLAESEFVRDKMRTDFLRDEDRLSTIRARLDALDRSSQKQAPLREKKFAAFPNPTIYPPALYLPQVAATWIARLFTDKVYVWFYSARVLNGLVAILLIFAALRIAATHQLLLLIPAVLPTSLYQLSSVSADAQIISLSILFVALCVRFLDTDDLALRTGLVVCLSLLTLGKPVHLPAGLLLLAAYRRLGWQRAIAFCAGAMGTAGGAYLCWSYLVRRFFAMAAAEFSGHNPYAQIIFIKAHPISAAKIVLGTLWHQDKKLIVELIGRFGWVALPLPHWFYVVTIGIGLAIVACVLINLGRGKFVCLIVAGLTAGGLVLAVVLGGFVLWMPVGSRQVPWVQGRYLLPALAILAFGSPPLNKFRDLSRSVLTVLILVFISLSCFWTVRIVKHYYFAMSNIRGRKIQEVYYEPPPRTCPASLGPANSNWWGIVITGRTTVHNQNYRVVLTEDDGIIVNESDPILSGGDGSRWLLNVWNVNKVIQGRLWFAAGKSACHFGDIQFGAYPTPVPPA
jgi:uncharacterized membrane protein